MLLYEDIYTHARKDLSTFGILYLASQADKQLNAQIDNQDSKPIVAVFKAYYNAWFFQLSSRLMQDKQIDPQLMMQHAGFRNYTIFPETVCKRIAVDVQNACVNFKAVKSTSMANLLNDDIKAYLLKTLAGAQTFAAIDDNIRNGAEAAQRIFPRVNTAAFTAAYTVFKRAFLDYVCAQSIGNAVHARDVGLARKQLPQLRDIAWIFSETRNGLSIFHYLCQHSSLELVSGIMARLAPNSMLLASQCVAPKAWQPTYLNQVLFAAAKKGILQRIDQCIQLGAQMDARSTGSGKSILDIAAEAQHDKIVQQLLQRGFGLSMMGDKNVKWSTLHIAVKQMTVNPTLIDCLLKQGADVNAIDINGLTPLHLSVQRGHEQITTCLLKAGARPNTPDEQGNTPLHLACTAGNIALSQLLIEYGALGRLNNHAKQTPKQCAIQTHHYTLAAQLGTWQKQAGKKRVLSSDVPTLQQQVTWQQKLLDAQREYIDSLRAENDTLKRERYREQSINKIKTTLKPQRNKTDTVSGPTLFGQSTRNSQTDACSTSSKANTTPSSTLG